MMLVWLVLGNHVAIAQATAPEKIPAKGVVGKNGSAPLDS